MHPSLYEINTRVWRKRFGADTKLLEVPDAYWQQLAQLGIDYVWLMGVWQTGPNVLQYALEPGLQDAYSRALPDWEEEDIIGSPYAIDQYVLHADLGAPDDLQLLKKKLNGYGLKLMLDFVPNHFHAETRWLNEKPAVFLPAAPDQLANDPTTFYRPANLPAEIFAHGKDPYFAAWQDTIQVNYATPVARAFMQEQLLSIAALCDGVRCDMAMLALPEVFQKTWGHVLNDETALYGDFWTEVIPVVKAQYPDFCFLAEVYWDLEWTLQQQGFDFTYDKRLRDRLLENNLRGVREHLHAAIDFQSKSARFLENHDEDRILAEVTPAQAQAAALATYTIPGLRFFYEGQWEGRQERLPVQLGRMPVEYKPHSRGQTTTGLDLGNLPGLAAVSHYQLAFYDLLLCFLKQPALREGQWEMLSSSDHVLAWQWTLGEEQYQVRINYHAAATEVHVFQHEGGHWRHFQGPAVAYSSITLGPYQWLILEKVS